MNNGLIRAILVTLCCASLGAVGCTSMHRVNSSAEALASNSVAVGDKVTLHYADGRSQHVKLTTIGDRALAGETRDGSAVEKQYAEILFLEYKKVNALKTAGLALGVVTVTVGIAAASMGPVVSGPLFTKSYPSN